MIEDRSFSSFSFGSFSLLGGDTFQGAASSCTGGVKEGNDIGAMDRPIGHGGDAKARTIVSTGLTDIGPITLAAFSPPAAYTPEDPSTAASRPSRLQTAVIRI